MTLLDIEKYMVEEYVKLKKWKHMCVIYVLYLEFYREFKNVIFIDTIWLTLLSMILVYIKEYMVV